MGDIILQTNATKNTLNTQPQRKIDYLVLPNIEPTGEFRDVDMIANRGTMIKSLETTQQMIQSMNIPAYTVITTGSDIKNLGKFNLRILSGPRID